MKSTTKEWLLIFIGIGAATLAGTLLGLSWKWRDALVYTTLVFAAVLLALRPAWGKQGFWRDFSLIFALHSLIVVLLVQGLPIGPEGFPGLVLTIVGVLESLAVAGLLWRRMGLPK